FATKRWDLGASMAHAAAFGLSVRMGEDAASARGFALAALGLAAGAAFLAGWLPLGFSIATVFLFAGPHNWIEARYFLSRLPTRWGKLRGYFLVGCGGVFGRPAAFAALPWLWDAWAWDDHRRFLASATWNSVLIAWVAALVRLRSQQNPR